MNQAVSEGVAVRRTASRRVFVIDLARGLAVPMMIGVHVMWMFGGVAMQTGTGLGHWLHLMGQGASAFLVSMGFSFMVTPECRLRRVMRRGVKLLSMAYLLNALKFLAPIYVFGSMPEEFIAAYGWHEPLHLDQVAYLLGTGDILHMAGIALLAMGLMRRHVPNRQGLLALMLGSIAFSALMRGTRLGYPAADYLLDMLWGMHWNVYFPVFPWIAHIMIGMILGMVYVEHGADERLLLRYAGRLGLVMLIAGWLVSRTDWAYHFHDFFHSGPGGTLYLIGRALCVFWVVARLLTLRPLPTWFRRAVRYLSVHVTTLYVMQWILICWAMGVVGFHALGPWQVLAMIPVMSAATLAAELGWRHLLAGLKEWGLRLRSSWWVGRRPKPRSADAVGGGLAALAVDPAAQPQGSAAVGFSHPATGSRQNHEQ